MMVMITMMATAGRRRSSVRERDAVQKNRVGN
jgi:hypothetical protein